MSRYMVEEVWYGLMTPKEEIQFWQSKFRLLKGYKITYGKDDKYIRQVTYHKNGKQSHICPFGRGRRPRDYIYHEVLHICLHVLVWKMRYPEYLEKEEIFIQDLCRIKFN